jgi:hypothetical protein
MKNALRTGVVFGFVLTAFNGSLELLPKTLADLIGGLSVAAWILCVGLAGARTRRRHPEASPALAAVVVVAVDSIRSTVIKVVVGATALVPASSGTLQPVRLTAGIIVLINLVIFLVLAPLGAWIGSLGARLSYSLFRGDGPGARLHAGG